jgi:hypothetical protein
MSIELVNEVFNQFEEVDDRIVTGIGVLDRLIHVHVTRVYIWETTKGRTERRIAKPANMVFAAKDCKLKHQRCVTRWLINASWHTIPIASPRVVLAG